MAAVIGIDYGHKKIGFAIGQTILGTANPLTIVAHNGDMWIKIDKVFSEWQPQTIIIGQPKLADGKEHPLEKAIQSFITDLSQRYPRATIARIDEAYTSFEAAHYQKGQKKQSELDAHAAAILLESWMSINC